MARPSGPHRRAGAPGAGEPGEAAASGGSGAPAAAAGAAPAGRAPSATGRSGSRPGLRAGTFDRVADPWGPPTPDGPPPRTARLAARVPGPLRVRLPGGLGTRSPWPVRVDAYLEPGVRPEDVDRWVQSASILHSNGDALDIAVKDGRIVGVRGRADDRVNHGRLGPKDLFGWQANGSPDRLTA